MKYVLVLLALVFGEFVAYYFGAKNSEGDKNKAKLAMTSFDLGLGALLFGIAHIEILFADYHTDGDWYYFLFYVGLILVVGGLVGVVFCFYEILRDRDNALADRMAAMIKDSARNHENAAGTAPVQENTQMYAAPAMQQPMQPIMPPTVGENTAGEMIRPIVDPENPYIITCPNCHTRQTAGRKICFECGATFDI